MKKTLLKTCVLFLVLPCASALVFANPPADDIKPENLFDYYSKATLAIEANVYYGDQDDEASPIETDFYLLDKDLVYILKKHKFNLVTPNKNKYKLTSEDYLNATAYAFSADDEESALLSLLITEAISKSRITKISTDRFGTGSSQTIRTGKYYLFGIAKTEGEVIIWNQPLYIKPGKNKIEMDQHNSDFIFSLN